MEKKHRNEELNFLYLDMDTKETTKKEKKLNKQKVNYKKKRNQRADSKKSAPIEEEKFNFDNEIVIGVTKIPAPKSKVNRSNMKKEKVVNNQKAKQEKKKPPIKQPREQKEEKQQEVEDKPKQKERVIKLIKCGVLLTTLGVALILFLLSPVFNITKIEVENNNKINMETYISLSQIQLGENTFKISKNKVIKNIKQDPYVEEVKVIRKLPDTIKLQVKERKARFAIEYASSYLYINSQGYILEIVEQNQDLPMIRSIKTPEEQLKVGNRLIEEDLEKLGSVLKIIEAANGVSIGQYITYIDIADKHNYILRLEEKKKNIYLGDDSNLSNKMLYSKAIIEKEEGIEGNIQAADSIKGNVVFQFKE